MFGKQIMPPDQADSPARRIYFALASRLYRYRGRSAARPRSARALIAAFKDATTSSTACEMLDDALTAAEADDCYFALKLVRRIIRHEDAVSGGVPSSDIAASVTETAHLRGINDSHAEQYASPARL